MSHTDAERFQMNDEGIVIDTQMDPKVLKAQEAFECSDKRRTSSRQSTEKIHTYVKGRDEK